MCNTERWAASRREKGDMVAGNVIKPLTFGIVLLPILVVLFCFFLFTSPPCFDCTGVFVAFAALLASLGYVSALPAGGVSTAWAPYPPSH